MASLIDFRTVDFQKENEGEGMPKHTRTKKAVMAKQDQNLVDIDLNQQFQMNTNIIGTSIKENSNEGTIGQIRDASQKSDDFFDRVNPNDKINIESSMKKMEEGMGLDDNLIMDDNQLDLHFDDPQIDMVPEVEDNLPAFDSKMPVFDKNDFNLQEIDNNIQELMNLTPKKLREIEKKVDETRKLSKNNGLDENLEVRIERNKEELQRAGEMLITYENLLKQLVGKKDKGVQSAEKTDRKSDVIAVVNEIVDENKNEEGDVTSG